MASLSDFLPHLRVWVPMCSEPLAEQTLRGVCADFCAISGIARETISIDLVAGQTAYTFATQVDTTAALILDVQCNGLPMQEMQVQPTTAQGQPSAFQKGAENSITINAVPTSSQPGALTLTVTLRPTHNANNIPDILFTHYAHEIAQGAASRLMRMPNQAFTDTNAAEHAEYVYQTARTDARIRADQLFGRVSLRVQPRRFS